MTQDLPSTVAQTPSQPVGSTRGSVAALAVYGLLFALGWLGIFCFTFVPQGLPLP